MRQPTRKWKHMPHLGRNDAGQMHVTVPQSPELNVIATSVHQTELREGVTARMLIVKTSDAVPHVREVHLVAAEGETIRHKDLCSISHGEIEDALDASMQLGVSVSFGAGRLSLRRPAEVGLEPILISAGRERKRTTMSDEFLREIAGLVRDGVHPREIAEAKDRSRPQVYRWIQRAREAGFLDEEK